MSTFDFDTLIDRSNTSSLKWDVAEGELPMWVADMDFEAAPCIREALQRRVDHGVFGYSVVPDAWYDAYISWWRDRHGVTWTKEELLFCTGVVPAISSMVRKLTTPAEKVLIQTPVYNIFFNSITNNGRQVLEAPLVYDGVGYSIDWEDLEAKLADPQCTLMILCNPHNPVGKIWDRETLGRLGALCKANGVTVISDEIHCDLTDPGCEYVPFAGVDEVCRDISITCLAPTKAFNIPGLQTSAIAISNPGLRHKVRRAINTDEVAEPNAFACDAAVAAFTKGGPWLDALREYIFGNKQLVREFLTRELPEVHLVASEATYLLWLDVSHVCSNSLALAKHIRKETGLFVTAGKAYGSCGKTFLRVNVACPRSRVEDGLARLKAGVESFTEE